MPARVKNWGHGALFLPPGGFSNPLPPHGLPPRRLPCWRLPRPHGIRKERGKPAASRSRPHAMTPALFKLPNFPKISHAQSRHALFYISAISAICPRPGISPARAIGRHESGRRGSARSSHQNAYFYRPQNPQNLDQTVYGILDQTVYENHAPQNTAEMAHRRQKRRIAPRKKHPSGYQTTENT